MGWGLKILAGLMILLALLVGVGVLLPKSFHVRTSQVIAAEPEQIHALVGDLERWDEWAPWTEEDPTVVTTLGDKTTGVGAHQSWTGKDGDGELTFTASDPKIGIAYDMAFLMGEGEDRERMPSFSAMTYEPAEGGTRVTWSMQGDFDVPVIGGYLAKMLPGQVIPMFDRGLSKLKAKAEAEPLLSEAQEGDEAMAEPVGGEPEPMAHSEGEPQ